MSPIAMKVMFLTIFLILSKTSANPVNTEETDIQAHVNTHRENLSTCGAKYSKSKTDSPNPDDYSEHDLGCGLSCYFNKSGLMKNNKIDVDKAVTSESIVVKYNMGDSFDETKLNNIMGVFRKCADRVNAKGFEDVCDMFVELTKCTVEEKSKLSI